MESLQPIPLAKVVFYFLPTTLALTLITLFHYFLLTKTFIFSNICTTYNDRKLCINYNPHRHSEIVQTSHRKPESEFKLACHVKSRSIVDPEPSCAEPAFCRFTTSTLQSTDLRHMLVGHSGVWICVKAIVCLHAINRRLTRRVNPPSAQDSCDRILQLLTEAASWPRKMADIAI